MEEDEIIDNSSILNDEKFLKELDRRIEELESGKVKGVALEEMRAKF